MKYIKYILIVLVGLFLIGLIIPKFLMRDDPSIAKADKECILRNMNNFQDQPQAAQLVRFGRVIFTGEDSGGVYLKATTLFGIPFVKLQAKCNSFINRI